MARKVQVNGAVVREWANSEDGSAFLSAKGLTVGARGRLSAEVQQAFTEATGQVYTVGHKEPQKITGMRVSDTGRKVPVTVKATIGDVRAWGTSAEGQAALAAQNLSLGARGRIAPAVLKAFAIRPKV